MPVTVDEKKSGEYIQSVTYRSTDRSVREVRVIAPDRTVVSRGYFEAGVMLDDPDLASKRKFHWIDAYSDEELLDPANNLIFTKEMIDAFRVEAVKANEEKRIVLWNVEDYKKRN